MEVLIDRVGDHLYLLRAEQANYIRECNLVRLVRINDVKQLVDLLLEKHWALLVGTLDVHLRVELHKLVV